MNALQDAWAGPLAVRMVSLYRTTALTYVRVSPGAYDEVTGTIPVTETLIPAAGAVVQTDTGERDGTQQKNEIEAWVDHVTVAWPISTNDRLQYLGRRWKITGITSYGSGGEPSVEAVYITTLDGKIITTLDGKALVIQGAEELGSQVSMYASKIIARAE
jgi:hypothetical protein